MTTSSENCKISDCGEFKRISIPLVRRIYPQLIANKITSVQPLLGPTGLVHYLRFRYSSNKQSPQQPVLDNGWVVKQKKKKVWRSITEPWEPSQDD